MRMNALPTVLALATLGVVPGCDFWRKPAPVSVAVPDSGPAPDPLPELRPLPPSLPAPSPQTLPTRKIPTAMAVPGKPGFVFSPFNHKIIDVVGIASGTRVADPTYPANERMHFRVP